MNWLISYLNQLNESNCPKEPVQSDFPVCLRLLINKLSFLHRLIASLHKTSIYQQGLILCSIICVFDSENDCSRWLHQSPSATVSAKEIFFTVLLKEIKSPISWKAWGWVNEQLICIFGWTLTCEPLQSLATFTCSQIICLLTDW